MRYNSSPAIGADGTIYVGCDDGKLYAVYSSSSGPANSPWPMFHHDVRHTGLSNYIALNLPKPTAAPPKETYPQPDRLFVDSGSFIRNHKSEFSAPTQQYLNDNLSLLDRFLLKAPVNKFLTETLTSPGWKSGFEKAQIISETVGQVFSLGSIEVAAKSNPLLSWFNLGMWSGKGQIYDKLKSDHLVRGIIDSASFVTSTGVAIITDTADPITALLSFNGIV